MKKVISIILLAVMVMSISCTGAFAASDAYKATWTVKASVMNAASTQQADKTNYINAKNKTVYSGAAGKAVCVYPGILRRRPCGKYLLHVKHFHFVLAVGQLLCLEHFRQICFDLHEIGCAFLKAYR